MIKVKATREGLVGHNTATGWKITEEFPFVALPSRDALNHWIKIRNPRNGKMCCALVLDIGPWNERDDSYVFQYSTDKQYMNGVNEIVRPLAESGADTRGRRTNGAGIDLGEYVWKALGMIDNTEVEWEFIS